MADDSIVAQYIVKTDASIKAMNDLANKVKELEAAAEKAAKAQETAQERAARKAEEAAKRAAATAEKEAKKAADAQAREANKSASAREKAELRAQAAAQKAAASAEAAARKLAETQAKEAAKAAAAAESAAKKAAAANVSIGEKVTQNLNSQFKGLAAGFAAAFTVDKLIDFGKEAVTLAGKAEGVRIAFERIGNGQLLDGLRKATKGTVSDLNLMTAAVRASNFKIPLEQMGTLLEFARRRAKETGEDIDYLVESIVVGIGRKSPLILDNLGISAVELRKRFKGISIEAAEVGDVAKIVGDIATDELKKMGEETLTSTEKIAKMNAQWENMKVAIGSVIAEPIGDFFEQASLQAEVLNSKMIDGSEKLRLIMAIARGQGQQALDTLEDVAKKEAVIAAQRARLNDTAQDMTPMEVEAELAKLRAAEAENEAKRKANEIRNVAFLTAAIKKLKEEQESEGTSIERVKQITGELIPIQEELDALLGKSKGTVADVRKEWEAWAKALQPMIAKGIPGLRQVAIDANGINNSLNTLNESLNQARAQLNAAPIGSDAFKQAEADIASLERQIKEALGTAEVAVPEMYKNVTSGIAETSAEARDQMERDIEASLRLEQELADERMALMTTVADLATGIAYRVTQVQMAEAERSYERIDQLLKDGAISDEEAEKRKKRIARQQAERNKEMATFTAIINTAMAVVNALATAPNFIVGAIMAAAAGVLGAAEIAVIQSEPLPSFGKGGWIDGKPHSHGGVDINAEGGEFMVNKKSARKYSDILEAINEDRPSLAPPKAWDGLAQSLALQTMFNDRNMLAAIDRHRDSEIKELREITALLKSGIRPMRGGYHA